MHGGSYYGSVLVIEVKNKILSLSSTMMLIEHQWLLWKSSLFFFLWDVGFSVRRH